jgi:hypothetical protein
MLDDVAKRTGKPVEKRSHSLHMARHFYNGRVLATQRGWLLPVGWVARDRQLMLCRAERKSEKAVGRMGLPGVLIVDDDVAIREVLHTLLVDAGYPVVDDATDGRNVALRLRAAMESDIICKLEEPA